MYEPTKDQRMMEMAKMEAARSIASGGVGKLAEPRNPTLTEKIKQLGERVQTLHLSFQDIERRLDSLIFSDTLQGGAAGETKQPAPMNADAELALCLESLAHLEGRMATMANRMERYL